MHAVVVTVEIDADRAEEARELLETFTIPTAKGMPGFISGSWMRSADKTRGTGVVILDSEDAANALAGRARQR
jgi:tRNA A58 N-methylase Trm61